MSESKKIVGKQDYDPVVLWSRELQGKKSEPVTEFGEPLKKLFDRIAASMAFYRGVGMAAMQIGIFTRAAIVDMDGTRMLMANPKIITSKGSSTKRHGCLSLPGTTSHGKRIYNQANVSLPDEITVQYLDMEQNLQEKTVSGWLSHAVQHEILHMDGLYFIDRCGTLSRRLVLDKYKNFLRFVQPE